MNKRLISELTKMDDVTFLTIEHHFHIARLIRDSKIRYKLSDDFIIKKLGIGKRQIKSVYNGSYPFDLRLLSKVQSMNMELAEQKAINDERLKVEAQEINFASYKHQIPAIVNKMEELVDELKKRHIELKHTP